MAAGIYIHVPFCLRKCPYCDFNSGVLDDTAKRRYLGALEKEIRECSHAGDVDTIYFGGGTPSLMTSADVETLISAVSRNFCLSADLETTVEVNPGSVDLAGIRDLKAAGINRLSIGVQSLNERDLRTLHRPHGVQEALDCLSWTRRTFTNFSVDLLYGVFGQTGADLRNTLSQLLRYHPPHISAYELTVEKGTPLAGFVSEGMISPPEEDRIVAMYGMITERLAAKGYVHYEISSHALPGFQCRHNRKYWRGEEYIGFGVSAHSLVQGRRYRNVCDIDRYVDGIEKTGTAVEQVTVLSDADRREEEVFLGLRTLNGIRRAGFAGLASQLAQLQESGLIQDNEDRIVLTHRGMLVANAIMVKLLSGMESRGPC